MPINTKLTVQIKQMFDIDQDLRFQGMANKELMKPMAALCNSSYKNNGEAKLGLGLVNFMIYMLDTVHNTKLYRIIENYGYPNKKMIGKKGLYYFWLLIQHQDEDPQLQENCLKNCDFEPKEIAYLTDRILVGRGKKQRYGTQFFKDKKTGKIKLRPVENIKKINKMRKMVGIKTTIEDDLKVIKRRLS